MTLSTQIHIIASVVDELEAMGLTVISAAAGVVPFVHIKGPPQSCRLPFATVTDEEGWVKHSTMVTGIEVMWMEMPQRVAA